MHESREGIVAIFQMCGEGKLWWFSLLLKNSQSDWVKIPYLSFAVILDIYLIKMAFLAYILRHILCTIIAFFQFFLAEILHAPYSYQCSTC